MTGPNSNSAGDAPSPGRVADAVATTLAAHGARRAFGMPGGEVVTLVDALEAAGIGFHLARHETAAAIMAAGAHLAGDALAVLVTTVGPGLANAVNGIADAAQERVPLIVLSGIVDRPTRARYTHQVFDHAAMLRPLVKASFEIEPESAAATVARAIALALAEPPGPVHLDLSPAVAAMSLGDAAPWPPADCPALAPDPASPAIRALAARLAAAERPLILAGFEAARGGAGPALAALAEARGIPVVTTYKAKGILPEDHPHSLGGAGLSPKADAILLGLMASADLVLLAGYDPIEMRLGWLDLAAPDRIAEITRYPADHGMHRAGSRIAAAPADILAALVALVPAGATWPDGEPTAARARLDAAFAAPASGFGPHAVVEALAVAAGDDAVVTVDSGAHRILLSQMWRAGRPLRLLQSAGLCTMAAALPLAIGVAAADPKACVFAVMGDGGLEMGIGELATLRDLGRPLTVVVFQDESLALIAMKQAAAGLAPAGVALGATDFAAIARGFGGHGETVASRADLDAAFAAAANRRDRFTLIACRFDASAYQNAF
ncbi:thiamine pyrophosphate-binding protein [Methylobrevis albus]|uniref:Thiamine pyrophosphate-binding protein n=1 Tax=Methylobrevis albus TaxID=2793297 RepID=A0A931HZX5_9HYPH|nr:thiamine pyrophosphate-dependent enzyme [Methylobrevis albus]MBH0237192.1 thiamine pyrophosphate-binding protein [Methylobrevis albus]